MGLPAGTPPTLSRGALAASAGPVWSWFSVAASGAGLGFVSWSWSVPSRVVNSLVFDNNIPAEERSRLLLYVVAAAATMVVVWNLGCILPANGNPHPKRRARLAGLVSPGILLGFWPLLNIQAFGFFHPLQSLFVISGFLACAVLVGYHSFPAGAVERQLPGSVERWFLFGVIALSVGYAVYFGLYTVGKHLAFHSYAFDLGWQNQVIYTLLHTGVPRITTFITFNPLSNHFWILFYLLAPLYALHQDPTTLLVLQAVVLSSGAVPLFLIARKRLRSPVLALVVAAVYLLYPAMHGANTYDFHLIVFLAPVFCFLLYSLEEGKNRLYWPLLALALTIREDVSLSLLGLGLYAWLVLRRRRLGLISLAVCLGYFLLTARVMALLGGSPNLENYWALGLPEHQDYLGVVSTLITNPFYVFKHVFFNTDKLLYLLEIFIPVLFLPFLAGKRFILLVPGLLIILLSQTAVQFSIGFHYSAHLIAPVFYLTIYGLQRARERWPRASSAAAALPLLLAGLSMNYEFGLILSKRFPGFFKPDERERVAYSFFRQIPADASVAATSRLYTHLCSRAEAYLLGRMRGGADFVMADLVPPKPASDPYEAIYSGHALPTAEVRSAVLRLLDNPEYGVLRYERGFVLLQRGHPPTRNAEVRGEILALPSAPAAGLIPYFQDPARAVLPRRLSESDRLTEFLRSHIADTIVIVGNGDVNSKLSYETKLYLIYRGSNILPLRSSSSYVAVIEGSEMVFERMDAGSPITVSSAESGALRKVFPGQEVTLRSTGLEPRGSSPSNPSAGSSIRVNGVEYSLNRRGLNMAVFDHSFNVIAQASFDTGP